MPYHSQLPSYNAIKEIWIVLTSLDEVLSSCEAQSLVLIQESVYDKLCLYLPPQRALPVDLLNSIRADSCLTCHRPERQPTISYRHSTEI
jgi:hypothetical protein